MLNFRAFTLTETEITPENRTSQKEVAPANHSFSGLNAASSKVGPDLSDLPSSDLLPARGR